MSRRSFSAGARQYILAGVLTVIPLWVTYLVFSFILSLLVRWGGPFADAFSGAASRGGTTWLAEPWVRAAFAIFSTLAVLYMIGWIATRVIGHRILAGIDSLMSRIPLAHKIYSSTRKLVAALQRKPDGIDRVVLIEFPSNDMKAVGFVTRTFTDESTGRELAAVYVPTTPNPTSGYLEIVPVDRIVSTNWTMDEAMSFIISGGAVAPTTLDYSGAKAPKTDSKA